MGEPTLIVATVAILCFGIFVQSAAGFAAGLLMIPLLQWIGYSVPSAMIMLLVATIPQNIVGVFELRRHIDPQSLAWPAIGRLSFLPIGMWMLSGLSDWPPQLMKQIVGCFVLAATASFCFLKPSKRQSIHPIWAWIAFPLSGWLQGIVGMGGPPLVLWVQSHDWSTQQSRGFLFAMYLISLVPATVCLWITFGSSVFAAAPLAVLTIPLLWPVTRLGIWAGSLLGQSRLRKLSLAMLFAIGVAGVLGPML